MLHFLITIEGSAPEGGTIAADTPVEIRRVRTPNDGFGRTIYADEPSIKTTFVQIENTLAEGS